MAQDGAKMVSKMLQHDLNQPTSTLCCFAASKLGYKSSKIVYKFVQHAFWTARDAVNMASQSSKSLKNHRFFNVFCIFSFSA